MKIFDLSSLQREKQVSLYNQGTAEMFVLAPSVLWLEVYIYFSSFFLQSPPDKNLRPQSASLCVWEGLFTRVDLKRFDIVIGQCLKPSISLLKKKKHNRAGDRIGLEHMTQLWSLHPLASQAPQGQPWGQEHVYSSRPLDIARVALVMPSIAGPEKHPILVP